MTLKKGWYWPFLLAGGMLAIVGVNTVMLFVANGDRNGSVVEPDYYRKAVAWDSTMAERAASDSLGWHAEVELDARAGSGVLLELRITDAAGAAVRGATVTATLIHNVDAARHVDVALDEVGGGRYTAAAPLAHAGRWEVRIAADRGGARFVTTRHTDLAVPGAD